MSAAAVDTVVDVDLDAVLPCEADGHRDEGGPATHRVQLRQPCCGVTATVLVCWPCAREQQVAWLGVVITSMGLPTFTCNKCYRPWAPTIDCLTIASLGAGS